MKRNKGITLSALVITIIIMLIIVVVTITSAVNGGLFRYAGKAKEDMQGVIDAEQSLANGRINIGGTWYNSFEDYFENNPAIEAGLFDVDMNLIISWEDLIKETPDGGYGLDVTQEYAWSNSSLDEYELAQGVILVIGNRDKEGNNITKIGDRAFQLIDLTCVVIPDTVESIGYAAFSNNELTSVILGNNVKTIEDYAFFYCANLTSITIPDSVTSIGRSAFGGCQNLTSITWKGTVYNNIDDFMEAFINYRISTSSPGLYGPEGLLASWEDLVKSTADGGYGLNAATNYTSSTYRTNTGSPYYILNNYSNLSKAQILIMGTTKSDGSNITRIGNYSFNNTNLISISIPTTVTAIGTYAFQNCSSLANINIPSGVKTIGSSAFYNCYQLKNIDIPSTVTTISSKAFQGCVGLNRITVDTANTTFDSRNNCNAIIKKSNNQLIVGCNNTVIPDTVTSIGSSAFYNCSGLTSVTIPSGVTSIGSSAFYNCSGLTGSITIPSGVTSIGSSAFYDCRGLTGSITIPSGVTSIGNGTFYGCSGLTGVTISEGVTSIGNQAFQKCSSLTTLNIPNGVTSISGMAFQDCSSLTSISIPNTVTTIDAYTFWGCSNLRSIELPGSLTTIGMGAFRNCTNLEKAYIPNSVTTINGGSSQYYYSPFEGCNNVTIYCQRSSVPSGWCDTWNNINTTDKATTRMNTSLETYRSN